MNHDALFKELLRSPAILRGFFKAFIPRAAPFIDFRVLEFVDKESSTITGKRRTGDLLIKTRFRGKSAGFLIHLEHQAQRDADLGRRMLEYFILDWREYNLPVYPIAVLSHDPAGPKISPRLRLAFPNKRVLEFDFDVIDLPAMDARRYVKKHNPAALALGARMGADPGERVRLVRDFQVTISQTRLRKKERDLAIDYFFAYQHLSDAEALQLEREMAKVKPRMAREKALRVRNPFIRVGELRGLEKGVRKGLREGLQQGVRKGESQLVLRLLSRRCGALSAAQKDAIRGLSTSRLEALGEALLDFASAADLARWLERDASRSGKR